jgi:hypothetical protein
MARTDCESNENAAGTPLAGLCISQGDAPPFVEIGEAGVTVGDAMRHQHCVQLVG